MVLPSALPAAPPRRLRRFKLFPKLPVEIRVMIWRLCLPGPRVVDIRMRKKSIPTTIGEILGVSRFISSVDHPVILHVCSESRSIARQHYRLSFPKKTKAERSPPKIYIDFSIDTIWFDNLLYFPQSPDVLPAMPFPKADFAKIKYLAMRHYVDNIIINTTRLITPEFFPALEAIYVLDTAMQPHPITLDVKEPYGSPKLMKLWEGEKKCPVVYEALALEEFELPSKQV